MPTKNKPKKIYLVAVDMGYGHQRAAFPLLDLAQGGVMTANSYPGISEAEKKEWSGSRGLYEVISRYKNFWPLGTTAFAIMDWLQEIEPFYPKRDLSAGCIQQRYLINQVRRGLGKNLIARLNKKPLPLVTTFFSVAYAAEFYNYQEEVYLIACDADVARSWAPLDAAGSRISYLVPNRRVKERLILYGVREQKIYISGFPLPDSNIGGKGYPVTKVDLRDRVVKLDPRSHYREKYHDLLQQYLGAGLKEKTVARPLTVTFAVGGAGAQRAQAKTIVHALKTHLQEGDLQLNLIAGSRQDVFEYFLKIKRQEGLMEFDNLHILYRANKMDYFAEFNQLLRQTDVLWTKPSELIFYSALGIPIIMAEPIGSQEGYNHDWLTTIGAGVDEQDPRYVDEWLFDWLNSGWLAQAAINGYLNAPKGGRHHIEEIVLRHRRSEIDNIHLL